MQQLNKLGEKQTSDPSDPSDGGLVVLRGNSFDFNVTSSPRVVFVAIVTMLPSDCHADFK